MTRHSCQRNYCNISSRPFGSMSPASSWRNHSSAKLSRNFAASWIADSSGSAVDFDLWLQVRSGGDWTRTVFVLCRRSTTLFFLTWHLFEDLRAGCFSVSFSYFSLGCLCCFIIDVRGGGGGTMLLFCRVKYCCFFDGGLGGGGRRSSDCAT